MKLSHLDKDTLKLKPEHKPFILTQEEYYERSMLRYQRKKKGSLLCKVGKKRGRKKHKGRARRWDRRRRKERLRKSFAHRTNGEFTDLVKAAPSSKTVDVAKFEKYVSALAAGWLSLWRANTTVRTRKIKFFASRRREAFMAEVVNNFERQFGGNAVVCFGAAADNGLFLRLKNGGLKAGVKELKRRLAEKFCVITCSEYRSSKLCLHCGRELKFYNYGVAYCAQQDHHFMINRDISAALKIAGRYIAMKNCMDLGPWAFGSAVDNAVASDALARAIIGQIA